MSFKLKRAIDDLLDKYRRGPVEGDIDDEYQAGFASGVEAAYR